MAVQRKIDVGIHVVTKKFTQNNSNVYEMFSNETLFKCMHAYYSWPAYYFMVRTRNTLT